jgi:hypothetical protein
MIANSSRHKTSVSNLVFKYRLALLENCKSHCKLALHRCAFHIFGVVDDEPDILQFAGGRAIVPSYPAALAAYSSPQSMVVRAAGAVSDIA